MKKVLVLHDEDLFYVSEIKEDEIFLRYSESENWTSLVRGKNLGSINDSGNVIKLKFKDIDMDLQYDEFVELYTLLKIKVIHDKLEDGVTFITSESPT